jgi:hypothetical protein
MRSTSAELRKPSPLRERGNLAAESCIQPAVQMRLRQADKIREIGSALADEGILTLDSQARALGLSRSTTWTILKASHKSSGLSAALIARMLAHPNLLPAVRRKIFEYIKEKKAGLYGDTPARLRKFSARLSLAHLKCKV